MTARATARLETRRVSPAGATGSADREAREERSASRSPFQTIGEIAGAGPRAHLQLLGRERLELHAALTLRHLGRWKSRARRSLASHAGGELLEVKRISQPKKRDGRYHAHESRQKSVCLLLFLDERDGRLALASARPRVAGHARESRRAFVSGAPRVCSPGVASVRVRRRRRERTERPRALGLLRRSRRQHHPRGGAVLDHRGLARGDGPSAPGVHRRGGSGEPRRRPAPDGPVPDGPVRPERDAPKNAKSRRASRGRRRGRRAGRRGDVSARRVSGADARRRVRSDRAHQPGDSRGVPETHKSRRGRAHRRERKGATDGRRRVRRVSESRRNRRRARFGAKRRPRTVRGIRSVANGGRWRSHREQPRAATYSATRRREADPVGRRAAQRRPARPNLFPAVPGVDARRRVARSRDERRVGECHRRVPVASGNTRR